MKEELEFERKFLVKELPKDLKNFKSKKLVDIYIPRKKGHAAIRIRQEGNKFMITKKTKMNCVNEAKEETIDITQEDFEIFKSMKEARIIEKTRYYYPTTQGEVEINIFEGKHKGFVSAEMEFESMERLNSSTIPDFCLTDITNEDFAAGGILCNYSFDDLLPKLKTFGYKLLKFS